MMSELIRFYIFGLTDTVYQKKAIIKFFYTSRLQFCNYRMEDKSYNRLYRMELREIKVDDLPV